MVVTDVAVLYTVKLEKYLKKHFVSQTLDPAGKSS